MSAAPRLKMLRESMVPHPSTGFFYFDGAPPARYHTALFSCMLILYILPTGVGGGLSRDLAVHDRAFHLGEDRARDNATASVICSRAAESAVRLKKSLSSIRRHSRGHIRHSHSHSHGCS